MSRRRRRSHRPAWWRELAPLGKRRRRTVKHLAHSELPGGRLVGRIVRSVTGGR